MYKYKISKTINSQLWNENLNKSDYSTFFQTYEYLISESSSRDQYPIFITIVDDSKNVKGQLGLVIHKRAKAYSSSLMVEFLEKFSNLGYRALWVGGPILHDDNKSNRIAILKQIIEALEKISKENNLILISGYTPPQDFLIDECYQDEFKKNKYEIQNFFTFVINLDKNLDEIWKNIHNSTRRDVNRSKNRNITVKELSSYDELDSYFQLSKIWAKTKGIETKLPSNYKERYWECIKSGSEKVFLSYQNNELIASHRLGCFNKIAHSHQLTNSYSKSSNLGGPILTWHAIEWAKKAGMRIYDFSGGESPPENENDKKRYSEQWETLLNYKRKWGGKEFPYYHLIKVQDTKKYKLFRILSKPDWILRNYKKKRYRLKKGNSNK